jgi:hypothetical protein
MYSIQNGLLRPLILVTGLQIFFPQKKRGQESHWHMNVVFGLKLMHASRIEFCFVPLQIFVATFNVPDLHSQIVTYVRTCTWTCTCICTVTAKLAEPTPFSEMCKYMNPLFFICVACKSILWAKLFFLFSQSLALFVSLVAPDNFKSCRLVAF